MRLEICLCVLLYLVKCQYLKTVSVLDSALLGCGNFTEEEKSWIYKDSVLYVNRIPIDEPFKASILLLNNYSLFIPSVSLEHEGRFDCFRGKEELIRYEVLVEVPPRMLITYNGYNVTREIRVSRDDIVTVKCHALGSRPAVNLTWMINNNIVDVLKTPIVISPTLDNSRIFNSVGILKGTLPEGHGNVSCVSSSQLTFGELRVDIPFYSYAFPNVSLTINDIPTNLSFVEANKHFKAECNAQKTKHPILLRWLINDKTLSSFSGSTIVVNVHNITFNATSQLWYQPKEAEGKVTCIAAILGRKIEKCADVHFYTYVNPAVILTVNGHQNASHIAVEEGDDIIAICDVLKARPKVKLSWLINNVNISLRSAFFNESFESRDNNMTMDSRSILQFLPSEKSGNISCVAYSFPGEMTKSLTRFYVRGRKEDLGTNHYMNILPGFASLLFFIFAFLCFILKRVKARRNSNEERMYRTVSPGKPDNDTLIYARQIFNGNSHEGAHHTLNAPRIKLPEVPPMTESSEYCILHGECSDTHMKVANQGAPARFFKCNEICLIYNIKTGSIYNRWIGTASGSNYAKKQVVFSTITDEIARRKVLKWDEYLKRLLDLPACRNIVKIEGICCNTESMFLIHDYIICETLQKVIIDKRNQDNAGLTGLPSVKAITLEYVVGILNGMDTLHSFGFLHPGMSPRKILVNNDGVCKLYDFCLAEDANEIISALRTEMTCNEIDFAPEVFEKSEYTRASDVWSTASVIWYIVFGACFPAGDDADDDIRSLHCEALHPWPEKLKSLRNAMVYECWHRQPGLRPKISELLVSFSKQMTTPSTSNSGSLLSSNESVNLYETMQSADNGLYLMTCT